MAKMHIIRKGKKGGKIVKIKKISIYILILTFLLGSFNAFAEGNNASLPSNPTTITGPDAWQYNDDVEAMRYSIYWAMGETREEAEENFVNNIGVVSIGQVTDISKTGLHYKVDRYTERSVFDYMNPGKNILFQHNIQKLTILTNHTLGRIQVIVL
jgi:hypothetical protein